MYHLPSGVSTRRPCPSESQRSSREAVRTIGLYGENSHGPSAWRLRAETTAWLVPGPGRAAFRNVQIEVAVVLHHLWTFQAGTFHARRGGHGPGLENHPRRHLHGQAIGVQLGHSAAGHIEKAPAILGNVRRIDCLDAQIDRLAPRAGRVIGMDNLQAARGRKINIEVVLILAQIRSPDRPVVAMKRRSNRTPVDKIRRVPDKKPRSVIEAGVREVEVIPYANGTAVRVVAAENGVADKRQRVERVRSVFAKRRRQRRYSKQTCVG